MILRILFAVAVLAIAVHIAAGDPGITHTTKENQP